MFENFGFFLLKNQFKPYGNKNLSNLLVANNHVNHYKYMGQK